ncbi:hypothetical protein [Halobacteriovorax sp. JY17]|uniref:hypothetical protein n=1 Tax=Halobacteriovorax sp. JY17 TaxID=2014617 RepID=UPI0025BCAD2D|nr:hypothetical protein [Halobacteriovorax sp. JY17]
MKKLLLIAFALTITACSSTTNREIANDKCSDNLYTSEHTYFDSIEKCRDI